MSMRIKGYCQCPYCKKLNPDDRHKCSWCYQDIPTRGQQMFQALVFWASITGILAAAYVAYSIGGIM